VVLSLVSPCQNLAAKEAGKFSHFSRKPDAQEKKSRRKEEE
jgi:hypothetical protein